jgi:hypothetical protein
MENCGTKCHCDNRARVAGAGFWEAAVNIPTPDRAAHHKMMRPKAMASSRAIDYTGGF